MIQIAVINESTVVANGDLPAAVAALQRQVTEHFFPAWGVDARLNITAPGTVPAPEMRQLIVADNSNQADALGYHETTASGLPIGFCFAKSTIESGGSWTVTASHEILEMLADPEINDTVFLQASATTGTLYMKEVCDAVEETQYEIDGVTVSNFVLPSYFEVGVVSALRPPFDYLKQLPGPLPTLLGGGYIGLFEVGSGGGWTQKTDMRLIHPRILPVPGNRRHRRMLPRAQWRRSERVPSYTTGVTTA